MRCDVLSSRLSNTQDANLRKLTTRMFGMPRRTCLAGAALVAACVLPAAAQQPEGANLAASKNGAKVVAVSSQVKLEDGRLAPQWQVTNAFDGRPGEAGSTPEQSCGWGTNVAPQPGQPEWVVVAFGADAPERTLCGLAIDPTTPSPETLGRWVRLVELQVSGTAEFGPYTTVGRFIVINRPRRQAFSFPPVNCRYARLLLIENHGSDRRVELGEIELLEGTGRPDTIESITRRLQAAMVELVAIRDAEKAHEDAARAGYGPIAGEQDAIVPSVEGMALADAQATLAAAGLKAADGVLGLPDPTVPPDQVLAQDREPGSVVPRGSRVQLTVSRGPQATETAEPAVEVTVDLAYAEAMRGTGKQRLIIAVTARGELRQQSVLVRRSDNRGADVEELQVRLDPEQTNEIVVITEGPATIEVLHEGRVVFTKQYPLPEAGG